MIREFRLVRSVSPAFPAVVLLMHRKQLWISSGNKVKRLDGKSVSNGGEREPYGV
jgi:hypothetical protein